MSRHILYVNTPTYTGGAEISLLTLMRYLDPARYTPLLVTSGEGRLTEQARQYGIEVVVQEFPWLRKRYPWRYPLSVARLIRTMLRYDVSLVHTNCDHSLRYLMHACRLTQCPYVSHVRDLVRPWFENRNLAALRGAERVLASSQALANECIHSGLNSDRVIVIYNPVDLMQYESVPARDGLRIRSELGIPQAAIVIGIVGQIQPIKGHMELIQAGLQLMTGSPMIHILVVGAVASGESNDRYMAQLHQAVAASHFVGSFHFTGFRRDIPVIMSALDILVVPSWTEAFGRVAVEGMAAGCAVVTTDAGGLPEIVHDGVDGLIVRPKDPHALRSALERLVYDPALRSRLGDGGRQSAQRFAVASHVEKMQDLYDQVLQEGRRVEERRVPGAQEL